MRLQGGGGGGVPKQNDFALFWVLETPPGPPLQAKDYWSFRPKRAQKAEHHLTVLASSRAKLYSSLTEDSVIAGPMDPSDGVWPPTESLPFWCPKMAIFGLALGIERGTNAKKKRLAEPALDRDKGIGDGGATVTG